MHYLHDYSTFRSTEELNKAVYEHIRSNTYDLNETDRKALKMISRYAVKYAGAAHLKADSIANLIGKSIKTARRVIDKLSKLGIVKKIATLRKVNGGKGANILCIQKPRDPEESKHNVHIDDNNVNDHSEMTSRQEAETPSAAMSEGHKNVKEPSYSNNLYTCTYLDTHMLPSSALRSALPHAIYTAMAPFFNAKDLYRYYGLLLKAKRKICPSTLIENNPEPYIEAFNGVMFKEKQGKVSNLESYLYTAFVNAATTVVRLEARSEDGEKSKAQVFKDMLFA